VDDRAGAEEEQRLEEGVGDSTMYPIWLIVDAARAFLMSSFAQPITAPNSSVTAPTTTTPVRAAGVRS